MTKRHSFLPLPVRLFCTAAALGLLAGCTAAPASSLVEASIPSSQTQPSGAALPVLSSPDEALNACLGWGAGTAGSSLHAVLAAAALLDWAEENEAASRPGEDLTEAFLAWYDALDEFGQETFGETWPLVCSTADALLADPDSLAGLMESAGLAPDIAAGFTASHWDALRAAVDGAPGLVLAVQ